MREGGGGGRGEESLLETSYSETRGFLVNEDSLLFFCCFSFSYQMYFVCLFVVVVVVVVVFLYHISKLNITSRYAVIYFSVL